MWLQADNSLFFNFSGLFINNGSGVEEIIQNNNIDRYWLRRLRPTIEGHFDDFFQYLINIDFGLGQINLYDAFLDINYFRALSLQIGYQFSLLSGIENYFDNFDYLSRAYTMEMSNTAMLAPDRQLGVFFHGSFGASGHEPYFRGLSQFGFDDMFSYQIGLFNGLPDNYQPKNFTTIGATYPFPNTDDRQVPFSTSNKAFEWRIFSNPFIGIENHLLQHLGFGIAGSIDNPNNQYDLPDLISLGQNPIFSYSGFPTLDFQDFYQVAANGRRSRIHPQVVWSYGSLGILADWTQTSQHLSVINLTPLLSISEILNNVNIAQTNQASQIQFIYNLTQEEFSLYHFTPNQNFHIFEKGAFGGFQMVFRMTNLLLDPSVFDYKINLGDYTFYAYADPRTSVQKSNSWSIGLNWFWNEFVRFTFEYDYSSYTGGCSTGGLNAPNNPGCLSGGFDIFKSTSQVVDRPAEKIFMQRIQLSF